MALVQLSCPLCGGWFQIDDAYAGMQVACPHCQNSVLIPAGLSAAPEMPFAMPDDEVAGMASPAEGEFGWSPGVDFPAVDMPPSVPGVDFPAIDFPTDIDLPLAGPGESNPFDFVGAAGTPAETPGMLPPVSPSLKPRSSAAATPAAPQSAGEKPTPARAPQKAPRPVTRKPTDDAQAGAPKPAVKRETSERRPTPAAKTPDAKTSAAKNSAAKSPEAKKPVPAKTGDSKLSSKSDATKTPAKSSEAKPATERRPQTPSSPAAKSSSAAASTPQSAASSAAKPKPAPSKTAAAAASGTTAVLNSGAAAPQRPVLRKAPRAELLLPMPAAPATNGQPRTYPQPQEPIPLPEFDESALPENPDRARFDKLFDPEQAAILKLKEPTTKVIQADGEAIQLRRLTPEEKAARRLKYNLIFVATTTLILAIILLVSLSV